MNSVRGSGIGRVTPPVYLGSGGVTDTGISPYLSKLIPVACVTPSPASPKRSFSARGFVGPMMCWPSCQ